MMFDILSGQTYTVADGIQTHLLNDTKWDIKKNSSLCAKVCALSGNEVKSPSAKVVSLSTADPTYAEIEQKLRSTLRKKYGKLRIELICNDFLDAFYLLRQEEYFILYGAKNVEEQFLFHGTDIKNVKDIRMNNFNWRFYGLANGCTYGHGVYFSPSADYSSWYCGVEKDMVLILASVLTSTYCHGNTDMDIPKYSDAKKKVRCDTSRNKNTVFVKYNDDEFYPLYFIHFKSSSIGKRNVGRSTFVEPEVDVSKLKEVNGSSVDVEKVSGDPVANENDVLNAVIDKFMALNATDKEGDKLNSVLKTTDAKVNSVEAAESKIGDGLNVVNQNEETPVAAKKKKRFFQHRKKKTPVTDSNQKNVTSNA